MQSHAIFGINFVNCGIKGKCQRPVLLFFNLKHMKGEINSMSHFTLSNCHQLEKKSMLRATNGLVEISYQEEGASHA